MILDAQLLFSDAQAVTSAAASTNLVDLGATYRDIGTGENLYVVLTVTTALTDSSSDSTVTVTLESETDANFGSATTVQTLFTIAATAAIGTKYVARINPGVAERFIRLYYTPNNGNLSTGAWTAGLVRDVDMRYLYPDNKTVS